MSEGQVNDGQMKRYKMAKIVDRATICWKTVSGQEIEESVVTIEINEEELKNASREQLEEGTPVISSISETISVPFENAELDKAMITFILEEMAEKLAILRCSAEGKLNPLPMKVPEYKTPDDRYGQAIEYDEDQGSCAKKRYADLNMIYTVITRTCEEMQRSGSYAPLVDAAHTLRKLQEDDQDLIKEEEATRLQEADLNQQLLTQKAELEANYAEKLEELRQLELKLENTIFYSKLEYKYLVNWEEARRHQCHLMQERNENEHRDIIEQSRIDIEMENHIHEQLVTFFNENHEELNNQIADWMYRYENEMEAREQEITKLRMDRDAQMEKYIQLKDSYEQQKDFIDNWEKIKAQREEEARLLEMQIRAATTIQTWWRNIMRRLHLGPYKKGKKGKGKAKKGAKKKK